MKTRTLSLLALTAALLAAPVRAQTLIEGPYVGLLPCPNCPGIRTELALERDAKTGAPRRYWLRENYLDARSGHRKHEFIAKNIPADKEPTENGQTPATALAPTLEADQKQDGSGSIEATLDARSVESIGPWQDQGKRIVIQTAQGPRQFERVSERTVEAVVGAKGAQGAKPAARQMQLRAAGTTGLNEPLGASFAGIVTRDPTGRLVLTLCGERGALILEDGARLPSVDVVLDNLGFSRAGSAYLELFGVQQGLHVQVKRVARASTDLSCATAQPAPVSLAINGGEAGWSLQADGNTQPRQAANLRCFRP